MKNLRYWILCIIIFTSCNTIHYSSDSAAVYNEFGNKSHYYSNRSRNFGIELYHGFKYYDRADRIDAKTLPKSLLKIARARGWETLFFLTNTLTPTLEILQRQSTRYSEANSANRLAQLGQMRLGLDTNIYALPIRLKGRKIYAATASFMKGDDVYRIISFSYSHQWLRSFLDTPSLAAAQSAVGDIRSSWRELDYVKHAFEDSLSLLQNASVNFWKSKNNYLFPLEIIDRHERSKRNNDYYEASTTFNSFAGNYWRSLEQRDSVTNPVQKREISNSISVVDARTAIYDSARKHQLLIINEAHTQPRNRRFFTSILDSLYMIGYQDIFYETLVYDDSTINKRRFPIQVSGYYSSEPNFGNNIRRALKLGYTVHAYDNESSGSNREILQAEVIAKYIKKHPANKVIIYCGHGHLDESPEDSMMGYFLKRNTGIDPFTIEQTKLIEKGHKEYEDKAYQFVWSRFGFSEPVALKLGDSLWVGGGSSHKYDMMVAIPPSQYDENNIPLWELKYGASKAALRLDGKQFAGSLLQIFCQNELKSYAYWDLVPISNLVLKAHNELTYYLEPGKYVIYVTDARRNILYQKAISL